jgi:hypothetical protein
MFRETEKLDKLFPFPSFSCVFFYFFSFVAISYEEYFAESINSADGFFGFRCESYFQYVFGWCNLKQKVRSKLGLNRVKMGEHCEHK